MTEPVSSIERLRSFLVLAATVGTIAFNWIAAAGYVSGVPTAEIFDRYPTVITPAAYAFSIWNLIYLGMFAFSIYQLLPEQISRFRNLRSAYILSCALNCAWIFFWHGDQIAISFAIIVFLLGVLLFINVKAQRPESVTESLTVKLPFGIYLGWMTAAALINFAVLLKYLQIDQGSSEIAVGTALVLLAAAFGVFIRVRLTNYFVPLAITWALTAIAIKQSGKTLIVSAAAVGVVACLIATFSFVMNLKSSTNEQQ